MQKVLHKNDENELKQAKSEVERFRFLMEMVEIVKSSSYPQIRVFAKNQAEMIRESAQSEDAKTVIEFHSMRLEA